MLKNKDEKDIFWNNGKREIEKMYKKEYSDKKILK